MPSECGFWSRSTQTFPRQSHYHWLTCSGYPTISSWCCLQAGQNDALAVLFDRYQKLVLSIALKIVRDPGEAEDVTQTVFLDIYRAVAQFDPRKGNTKVWLMQYAYHRAINRRQHLNVREFYTEHGTGRRST